MLSKPFAISELSDPSQVRVVLYSGGGFVHAPLQGIIDLVKRELDGSLKDIEKRLEALIEDVEDLKECSLDEAL